MLRKEESRLIAPTSMRLGNGEGCWKECCEIYRESQGSQCL